MIRVHESKGGQTTSFDFQDGQIRLGVDADDLGFHAVQISRLGFGFFAPRGPREDHRCAHRALYYVSVGYDIALRVYDHARTRGFLPSEQADWVAGSFSERSVSADYNLHNRWRDALRKRVNLPAKFDQPGGPA